MKVQVLQEDLNKALGICSRFSSNRVQLPVLANILFETQKGKLRIASTNLEVSASLLLGAKVEEEGSITVPTRLITELVTNLKPGQVSLSSKKESLNIKTSDFESQLSGINSADFPKIPQDLGAGRIKFLYDDLQESLSKVLYSVSTDETRPILTGVLMIMKGEEIMLVSTDGFRLSQKKLKLKNSVKEGKVIIPKNTLSELSRLTGDEEVELLIKGSENQIVLGVGNVVLSSRVIEGEFPDFEKIIPKSTEFKIGADREEMLRNIKLASVLARDSANVVRLAFGDGSLEISAESQQYGTQKSKLDVKLDGKPSSDFTIAFNYRFLEEFLNSVKGSDVKMEFSDPNSPAVFLDPKDSEYLHIIMPVRIQG